ncbi:MAG: tetratricopeptide repeat protein [candidate division Zixibacteria bacterium]|nr:tetratricopeptide repeat protein [candidate division Zixibacteria bacterium]
MALYFLGRTLEMRQLPDSALRAYNAALQVDWHNTLALVARAGMEGILYGDHASAITDLNRAIRIDRKLMVAYLGRALLYLEMKEYDLAVEDCNVFLDKGIFLCLGHALRGRAHFEAGQFSQAIIDFTDAIELDDSNFFYYLFRGLSYARTARFQPALLDIDRAFALDSANALVRFARGTLYYMTGQPHEALTDFTAALADSVTYQTYAMRALTYISLEDFDKASSDMDSAIAIDSSKSWLHTVRGLVKFMSARPDSAVPNFSVALARDSSDARAWACRADAYLALGRWAEARSDYQQSLSLDSASLRALYGLALTCDQIGDLQCAVEYYSKFVDKAPPVSIFFINKARDRLQ